MANSRKSKKSRKSRKSTIAGANLCFCRFDGNNPGNLRKESVNLFKTDENGFAEIAHFKRVNDYLKDWHNKRYRSELQQPDFDYVSNAAKNKIPSTAKNKIVFVRAALANGEFRGGPYHVISGLEIAATNYETPRYQLKCDFPLFRCDGSMTGYMKWADGYLQFVPVGHNVFGWGLFLQLLKSAQSDKNYFGIRDRAKEMLNDLDENNQKGHVSAAPHTNGDKLHITICIAKINRQYHVYVYCADAHNSSTGSVVYDKKHYFLADLEPKRLRDAY